MYHFSVLLRFGYMGKRNLSVKGNIKTNVIKHTKIIETYFLWGGGQFNADFRLSRGRSLNLTLSKI